MSIQELVPSKDLCEQLAAAGFPQETVFGWFNRKKTDGKGNYFDDYGVYLVREYLVEDEVAEFAAPTAEEILDRLPDYTRELGNIEIGYCATDHMSLEPNKGGLYGSRWFNVSYWSWDTKFTPKHNDLYLERVSKYLQQETTLVSALAKMYLYLKSNNLI